MSSLWRFRDVQMAKFAQPLSRPVDVLLTFHSNNYPLSGWSLSLKRQTPICELHAPTGLLRSSAILCARAKASSRLS